MVEPRRLRRLVELPRSVVSGAGSGAFVVALSGGADSAAAAWLAVGSGRPTRAIHVHHGALASDRLQRASEEICRCLEIELAVVRVDVPDGPSYEAQARRVRHDALAQGIEGDGWLVTGHTRDDQVETLFMRLIRGTGIDGLAGMGRSERPHLRPLLDVTRSDAREIATLARLPWRDDPANRDPRHLRNRVRREVMPMLESAFGPGVATSLFRTADVIRRDVQALEELAAQIERRADQNIVELSLPDLRAADEAIAARAIRNAIRTIDPPYPPRAHVVDRALDVIRGRSHRLDVGDLAVTRSGHWLRIELAEPSNSGQR